MTLLGACRASTGGSSSPLGLLAVVNVGVVALAVYPLSLKVSASEGARPP